MARNPVPSALEEAALHIGRLDARVSTSPLSEAWQVRACIEAGVALSAVDGTPTRSGDVAALLCGGMPPSIEGLAPAASGLKWWRLAMADLPLSERVARLVGRTTTRALAAAEAQADWDHEDRRPKGVSAMDVREFDAFARDQSRRAGEAILAAMGDERGLRAVARGLREALARDPDPRWHDRAHGTRSAIARQAMDHARVRAEETDGDRAEEELARMGRAVGNLDLRPPSRLGAAHSAVASTLQASGITASRLSCLTGATKRLGFEGRVDDRAMAGFLRTLAREARAGIALLEALEATAARWVDHQATHADVRSRMPEVLHALLVLPAVDVVWLCQATGMEPRVAQKFTRRLADAGLTVEWTERRSVPPDAGRAADVRLWMAAEFERDYDRAVKRRGAWVRTNGTALLDPSSILSSPGPVDMSVPMAEVFRRFDAEIAAIVEEHGIDVSMRIVRRS